MPSDTTPLKGASKSDVALATTAGSGLQPASFVSSLLAERLVSGRPLSEAETLRVQGALMLTDIEGWTARVRQLSGTGPEGLDALGRAMNSYVIDLAEIVYGYGGDLLVIMGDAFLCCWLARSRGTGRGEHPPAQAALAHQATEDRHSPGARHLRTRIGIAAGKFEVAIVGGVNGRWELLPVGDPLDQVADAERHAPPGAVAVAGSAWEHLEGRVQGVELDQGGLVVVTSPPIDLQRPSPSERILQVSAEALAPFVPAPVRGPLAGAGGEWLAELRRVTVVMVRLLDRSGSLSARIERIQLAVRILQQTIAQHEGACKTGTDSKGMTLSAVFGLPPRAHEDDAERALRAAAALSERLAELGVPCSFGVASGRAFCGLFGSDLRREYTLHGDVTNLAARLAYAGDGEILCDETTARAMNDRYRFEVLRRSPSGGAPNPYRSAACRRSAPGPRREA